MSDAAEANSPSSPSPSPPPAAGAQMVKFSTIVAGDINTFVTGDTQRPTWWPALCGTSGAPETLLQDVPQMLHDDWYVRRRFLERLWSCCSRDLAPCAPALIRILDHIMGDEADQIVALVLTVPVDALPATASLFEAARSLLKSPLLRRRTIGLHFLRRIITAGPNHLELASCDHRLKDELNSDLNASTVHLGEPLPPDHPVFSLAE